jgi:hypothetical protein
MSSDGRALEYDLNDPLDREDRRKHLELVSAVIARMANASAAAKGWSITLAGAAFGIALVRDKWYLILLGIVALVLFALVDGMYLHNEKRFRDLYDAIAVKNSVPPFAMSVDGLEIRPKNRSFVSWSILFFYLPLILGGVILIIATLCVDSKSSGTSPASTTQTTTTATVTVTVTPTQIAPKPIAPTADLPSTPAPPMPTAMPPSAPAPQG